MSRYILGFDVGGTKISAVIGDEGGNIIAKVSRPTVRHLGKKRLIQQMIEMGHSVMEKAGSADVSKIGIIFAGLVDSEKGIVKVSPPNILGLNNFAITRPLSDEFGVEAVLENDATAATIAERVYGSGRNVDNFVYLTLSTGIGGGGFR